MVSPLPALAQQFIPDLTGSESINVPPLPGFTVIGRNALGTQQPSSSFAGTINIDPSGLLLKAGTGTVTIDGATIAGGEFRVTDGAVAQTSGTTINNTSVFSVGNGTGPFGTVGSFNVSGGMITLGPALHIGDFTGTGTVNQTGGTVVLGTGGAVALNIGNQGGTGTYNLSGGTLTFNGTNATTTSFIVLGRNSGSGASAQTASTGVLNLSGTGTMVVTNGASLIIGSNGTATPSGAAGSGTFNQTGGALTIQNGSQLFLSAFGNGTYNLNGGTLQIGGTALNGNYNNTGGTYTFSLGGGTIQVIGSPLIGTVNPTLVAGTTSTIDTNGIGATWSGVFSGGGALAKAGAGMLTLSGANTYTGATTVAAGTLAAGAVDTLPALTAVTVDAPGTLDLANFDQSIGSLAGAGSVTLGSAKLTTGNDNTNTTFSGVMSGTGALDKVGTGTFILSGDNSYTGGTTISGGTLQLGSGGASGNIVGDVADNGTLSFGRSDTLAFPGVISGSGSVSQVGTGVTVLTADNPYTGGTTVKAGTLAVGDPAHPSASLSGGGPIDVAPGGTLGGFGSVTGSVTNDGTVTAGNATPGFDTAAAATFTVNGSLLNRATVNLASDPIIGNVLAVRGDYVAGSRGSTLVANTLLSAGGPLSSQVTDRLLVFGNTSGDTIVRVNGSGAGALTSPTGVPDAADGISLVQVAGVSSFSAFTLPGGYIDGGTPFQYHLNAYGPGSPNGPAYAPQSLVGNAGNHWDYRLQSAYVTPEGPLPPQPIPPTPVPPITLPPPPVPGQPTPVPPQPPVPPVPPDARLEVAPQVPAYITAPTALFNAGFQDLDSLHRRLGEIRDDQAQGRGQQGEVFLRAYGSRFNYTSDRSFTDFGFNSSQDYAATQFGGNWIALDDTYGTLRVGLAGTIGQMWFQPSAVDGASKGLFNTQSLAGTVTWQSRAGWYVDTIIMGGLFDGRFTTPTRGQTTGMNGTSVAASLEAGYPIPLGWQGLSIEPQVQFVYQHLDFAHRTDVDGIDVDLGSPDQGVFRGGARLTKRFAGPDGMLFTPYLKANVLQGIGGGDDVHLSSVSFGTGHFGTALQVGGGITGTLTRDLSVYGDVAWQHDVGGGGSRGWAFNGGLRYAFGAAPAPVVAPAVAAPAPAAARTYLVFFDWDKATLTDRARQIIGEAAAASQRVQLTRIEVNGYTDTSGTAALQPAPLGAPGGGGGRRTGAQRCGAQRHLHPRLRRDASSRADRPGCARATKSPGGDHHSLSRRCTALRQPRRNRLSNDVSKPSSRNWEARSPHGSPVSIITLPTSIRTPPRAVSQRQALHRSQTPPNRAGENNRLLHHVQGRDPPRQPRAPDPAQASDFGALRHVPPLLPQLRPRLGRKSHEIATCLG